MPLSCEYSYVSKRESSPEQRWIRSILLWGSERAAEQLVGAHYDGLLAYISSQVADRQEAQNLTQETFIGALRSLASYDPAKAGFRTWLYRIATYKIIDYWRRTPPQMLSLSAPEPGESSDSQGDWLNLADPKQGDMLQGEVNRDLLERICCRCRLRLPRPRKPSACTSTATVSRKLPP